jgi:NADP-dependent 3-hydroxy acid dehydrogenase YdfG
MPWRDRIVITHTDVTDRAALTAWITTIHQQTGRIDVLVNNAGFLRWGAVTDVTIDEMERMVHVGFWGMVYGVKAALPLMLTAGRGQIVTIGSAVSQSPVLEGMATYTATKAAIDTFTRVLQIELRHTPIQLSLIRPTTVAGTAFLQRHVPPGRIPRMVDFTPTVTPPQVAAAVVRALRERHAVLNVPGHLPIFYALSQWAPRLMHWLTTLGGPAKRDYAHLEWEYRPKDRTL